MLLIQMMEDFIHLGFKIWLLTGVYAWVLICLLTGVYAVFFFLIDICMYKPILPLCFPFIRNGVGSLLIILNQEGICLG